MTKDELIDAAKTARLVGQTLKLLYKKEAWQETIQDGKSAGQTVPHLHVHVIPVDSNSFDSLPPDDQRLERSLAEMNAEARAIAAYGAVHSAA